ncbi:MAG: hypothetical protein HYZ53_02635 [Planctomycetes bacterium]|nr:hypothetical protein [Planctomycetota bacterium]
MKAASPDRQLAGFLAKYTPEISALAAAVIQKLRARLPGARVLVYDNYNALAVAFGATERVADLVLSIALYPRWVNLFFSEGASLPDPSKVLQGSGKRIRSVVLESAADLEKPAIRALIEHALARATPIDPTSSGQVVIKAVSTKQRPRRPAKSAPRVARTPEAE